MKQLIPVFIAIAAIAFAVCRRRLRGTAWRRFALPGLSLQFRSPVALVAAREIRQRARGRLFRVVTLVMLAGVALGIVISAVTGGGTSTLRVGTVGKLSATDRAAVVAAGTAGNTHVRLVSEASAMAADRDLRAGRIRVAVLGAQRVVTKQKISASDTSATARVAHAIAASLGQLSAAHSVGVSAAQATQIARAPPLPTVGLQSSQTKGTIQAATIVGVIALFILLTQYNTWTLVGVMEEKSSRVVEVLLATVRPAQLLAGKVIGIGLLVFAQAGLVVGVALAIAAAVGSELLNGAGPATVLSTLVWLVLGYAFYSWMYAAAGSMAERQDQVQTIALPIAAPMIFGYIFSLTVASSGNSSTFFEVLAYLPPTAPFAMPVLVGLKLVAWWQVLAAALISVAATIGMARLAATVYRRAVLRTGRRVRIRDLLGSNPAR